MPINGPFPAYAPPGVYTETRVQTNVGGPPSTVLLPVFIGTGRESLTRTDFELVRGSSSQVDQQITNEDPSGRFVVNQIGENNFILGNINGVSARFQVLNFPMVRGDGAGLPARAQDVSVTINGVPVQVGVVDAENGIVTLQVPPQVGDVIRVTYFFNRTDTFVTDDVSAQVTSDVAELIAALPGPYTVVAGSNDTLALIVDGTETTITLSAVTGATAADIALDINGNTVTGLTATTDTNNIGQSRLVLQSDVSLVIGDGNANALFGFFQGQATSRNAVFQVFQGPIVDGSNGGVITTDPQNVTVRIDGAEVTPLAVDGTTRQITLSSPPASGSEVLISYFFNTWEDTFDYLPDTGVLSVSRVGLAPQRTDFLTGTDYVVQNDRIIWGAATEIRADVHTAGSEFFDDSQISTTLVDNKIFLEEVSRIIDRNVVPPQESAVTFELGNIPTLGNGRDTVLDFDLFSDLSNSRQGVTTNRPDLIQIYHGPNLTSALSNGSVGVVRVDGANRQVTVSSPIPPDHRIWATYYYNRLRDDEYTLEVLTQSSGTTPGQYSVTSQVNAQRLYDVRFGTKTAVDTIQWPSGSESRPDGFVVGTNGVNETVTVTFNLTDAEPAIFTNKSTDPYDLYGGFSDQLYMNLSGTAITGDLSNAGFGVLVSDTNPTGTSYTITAGTNDEFSYTLDGSNYMATIPAGSYTGVQIADRISRAATPLSTFIGTQTGPFDILSSVQSTNAAPFDIYANVLGTQTATFDIFTSITGSNTEPFDIFSQITGSNTEPFDIFASQLGTIVGPYDIFAEQTGVNVGPYDIFAELTGTNGGPFDIFTTQTGSIAQPYDIFTSQVGTNTGPFNIVAATSDTFNFTVNGTAVSATLTTGGAVATATVLADLSSAATTAGLTVGVLTTPTNDVEFVDNGGAVEIKARESLLIGTGNANSVLGFTDNNSTLAPNAFDLTINGTAVSVTFTGGENVTAATVVSEISSAATTAGLTVGLLTTPTNDVEINVTGGNAVEIKARVSLTMGTGTANAILGFTDNNATAAPNGFDVTINGTPVTVTFTGGESIPATTIESEIEAAMTTAGLTVGAITTPTNDVEVNVTGGSEIEIKSLASILIGTGSSNTVLGFTNGASDNAPNTFDLTINGTTVNVIFTGGESIPTATIVTEISSAMTTAGLTVGALTTLTNDVFVQDSGGAVNIRAKASVATATGTANTVLGFTDSTTVTANNTFLTTINGTTVNTTFSGGESIPIATIISEVSAAATTAGLTVGAIATPGNDVEYINTGGALEIKALASVSMGAGTSNTVIGFTNGATDNAPNAFDVTINGTLVNVTFSGGESIPAATLISEISAAATTAGLSVGVLATLTNDVELTDSAGQIDIKAKASILIGSASANAVLGFTNGASNTATNAFDVTINGTLVNVTFSGGENIPASVLESEIEAAMTLAGLTVGALTTTGNEVDIVLASGALVIEATQTILIGTATANPVLGFVNSASASSNNTFIVTVNGTLSTTTLSGGRQISAATIESEIEAQLTTDGLTVGLLTASGNEADVLVTTGGALDIQGTVSVTIGAGTANAILGFTNGTTDSATNTFITTVNGTLVNVTFTGGRQIPATTIESEIEAAMTLAGLVTGPLSAPGNVADVFVTTGGEIEIRGTVSVNIGAGTANTILGFTNGTSDTLVNDFDATVNGTLVNVTFTAGASIPATTIASEINAAMTLAGVVVGAIATPGNEAIAIGNADETVTLSAYTSLVIGTGGTNPVLGFTDNASATNIIMARYRTGTLTDRLLLRSRVTPTGPGDVSQIRVLNGNANATLGFTSFVEAFGAESAVNKPATLAGSVIGASYLVTLAANDPTFTLKIDGTEYNVSGFGAVGSVADVASVINGVIGAAGTAASESDALRITSASVTPDSSVEIGSGAIANGLLGFSGGERALQRMVSVGDVAAVLNSGAADWLAPLGTEFPGLAFAEKISVLGQGDFLKITTFEEGALQSITFLAGSNNALNDTGMGIEIGDSVTGVAPVNGFVVASNNTNGSSGTGVVGQTYTDAVTGLRFTILPATDGMYTSGEDFNLIISDTFVTGSSVSVQAIPGIEMLVTNTTDIGIGDTSIVETFDKSGFEPEIGDFYYISYAYQKTNFDTGLFTQFADIQNAYGALSPENPLTLAAYLAILNGAAIVGLKQVLRAPGTGQASVVSYNEAIKELEKPLVGGVRPDIIVPLTSDTSVFTTLVRSCEVQSSPRNRQERRAIFGTASGTRPSDAISIARGLNSSRAILVYPDSALLTLQNEIGENEQFIVDGTFLAAALAGVQVNPQFDVAEPLTRKTLVGFDRLARSLDETEKNQLAVAGITVLEDRNPSLVIRQGLTTNVDSRFTATPSIIAIQDFVQQRSRAVLGRFIGQKFLQSRVQDVELALTGLLNSLVEAQIIVAFTGVSATPDRDDPTTLRVEAFYAPIFPLLYIPITFTISSSIANI